MVVRADVTETTTAGSPDWFTDGRLVLVWVVQHFFAGMRILAINSLRALVNRKETVWSALVGHLDNVRANFSLVPVDIRVTTEPTTVNFHVGHPAKLVVVVITLRAPSCTKFAGLYRSHLPQGVDLSCTAVRSIHRYNGDAHIPPDIRGARGFFSEKDAPFVRR